MLKKIFYYPSKNLSIAIPIILVIGFIVGIQVNTSALKAYILPATFMMIYPTMIGFKLKEAVDLSHYKVVLLSLGVNFLAIPLIAYVLGKIFLSSQPELFVGLVMVSLFPTSGMTISWTMLSKGNVAAAIKITAISLILGSLLAPWYLLIMVGEMVEIDIYKTFISIAQVVVIPLILGNITFVLLQKKYSIEEFNKKIKPILPAISVWAMLFIVFISISMKSKAIVSKPQMLLSSLLVLVIFYIVNFLISTVISRMMLKREDGFALLYGTVMRNLTIALGLAAGSFGSNTALIITLAYILQIQSAAWYGKLASKHSWL